MEAAVNSRVGWTRRVLLAPLFPVVLLTLLALSPAAGGASAEQGEPPRPAVSSPPPQPLLSHPQTREGSLIAQLPGSDDPALRDLWLSAFELEREQRHTEAITIYEQVVARQPESAYAYWRISRSYWQIGDLLPRDAVDRKIETFELADDWARRGIEVDARCAECMLWRYAALGRVTVNRGLISGVRYAGTMSDLLDDAIALRPTHRDSAYNSTLGNLYYARAIFNRMVPDSFWLDLLVGVRGDKEQALRDIDHALEINGGRIDYRVEKGAVLLCLGTTRQKAKRVDEGKAVLRDTMALEEVMSTDGLEKQNAQILIDEPEKACGYSRDGFVDVDAAARQL